MSANDFPCTHCSATGLVPTPRRMVRLTGVPAPSPEARCFVCRGSGSGTGTVLELTRYESESWATARGLEQLARTAATAHARRTGSRATLVLRNEWSRQVERVPDPEARKDGMRSESVAERLDYCLIGDGRLELWRGRKESYYHRDAWWFTGWRVQPLACTLSEFAAVFDMVVSVLEPPPGRPEIGSLHELREALGDERRFAGVARATRVERTQAKGAGLERLLEAIESGADDVAQPYPV